MKLVDMVQPNNKKRISRRGAVLAGGSAFALLALFGLKPKDVGANHSPYFLKMSEALTRSNGGLPTLVIDKAQLLKNIDVLKQAINTDTNYRIVVKSLPSLPLLDIIMQQTQSRRLMVFHQPFLNQVAKEIPQADVLMGKPLPVAAANTFYEKAGNSQFKPSKQLQWLVDTPERMKQYADLANGLKQTILINIELDVGLHRGGVKNNETLHTMLTMIESEPYLSFSGFMGYEPHVAKVPGDKLAARDKAMAIYRSRKDFAASFYGRSIDHLTLNAGGSPTYQYYKTGNFPHNELSAGSCLVKPTDFDLPSLSSHVPASFIATPVLKSLPNTEIPGVPGLGRLMSLWNPNRQQTFFTYGGYWKAKPESPEGLSTNPVFGRSTNQEMYNGSSKISLKPDDWIFQRPTQSEFVFLQFGDIAVYDQGEIGEYWPIFG